jgi:Ran GTPase-activating protein (RanGAP) involved in mRNA processing and transport
MSWQAYDNDDGLNDFEVSPVLLQRLKANDPRLVHLSLTGCPLDADTARELGAALMANTALKSLCLMQDRDDGGIGPGGAKALAEMLRWNSALTYLNIEGNEVGEEGAGAIAAALEHNSTLQWLECGAGSVGDGGCRFLAQMAERNTSLTRLDLHHNHLGDGGAFSIGAALARNTTLRNLDLSGNSFSSVGLASLFAGLDANTTLRLLNLAQNAEGEGVQDAMSLASLASLLEPSRLPLTHLDLSHNFIDLQAIDRLARGLARNRTLTRLDLGFCHLPQEAACLLAQVLRCNTPLRSLSLRGNSRFGALEGRTLVAALECNSTLTFLDLEMTGVDGGDFAAMLPSNMALSSLSLPIFGRAILSFQTALRCNFTLTQLQGIRYELASEGDSLRLHIQDLLCAK